MLASATIALNTSTLYVGQAIGSGLAGALLTHGRLFEIGYGSLAFIVGAVGVTLMTRPMKKTGASSSS